ncbi:MAG TPA: PorV/PorQ family protein [Elusimicrobiota bacterium]|nr:PorV/PorQ family protein [Elusimicrobiota bacterium]
MFFCLMGGFRGSAVAGTEGATGAEFLKLSEGARAVGMGESQVALSGDVYSPFWNPAGLARVGTPQGALQYGDWLENSRHHLMAVAWPVKKSGAVAVGCSRLETDPFPGFDAQGSLTGTLRSDATVLTLSWGQRLFSSGEPDSGLMGGCSIKGFQENLAGVTETGFAADVGLLWRPGEGLRDRWEWLRHWGAGVAVKNLGPGVTFDREPAPLPLDVAAGLAYSQWVSGDLISAEADWHSPVGEDPYGTVGVEYWCRDLLALRGGFRMDQDSGPGVRAGLGVRLGAVQLDYAWAGYGDDLGPTHRISMTVLFGHRVRGASRSFADELRRTMDRGRSHMLSGFYDKAVLDFHRALQIDPENNEALTLLMECGEKMEDSP